MTVATATPHNVHSISVDGLPGLCSSSDDSSDSDLELHNVHSTVEDDVPGLCSSSDSDCSDCDSDLELHVCNHRHKSDQGDKVSNKRKKKKKKKKRKSRYLPRKLRKKPRSSKEPPKQASPTHNVHNTVIDDVPSLCSSSDSNSSDSDLVDTDIERKSESGPGVRVCGGNTTLGPTATINIKVGDVYQPVEVNAGSVEHLPVGCHILLGFPTIVILDLDLDAMMTAAKNGGTPQLMKRKPETPKAREPHTLSSFMAERAVGKYFENKDNASSTPKVDEDEVDINPDMPPHWREAV